MTDGRGTSRGRPALYALVIVGLYVNRSRPDGLAGFVGSIIED
jgi:fructose-specific phosphotransferase system IIC component